MKNKPVRGSGPYPDHIMISINGDPCSEMVVTWRTDISVKDGFVEYREENSSELFRCPCENGEFISDIDENMMHWAHLSSLRSGTRYFYTCGDEEHRSREYSFVTKSGKTDKFRFICVSDQQRGDPFECPDYSYFNAFIKRVLRENPDIAFILTGGDNTDCGQHEVQWNGAFSGFEGISESVPVMMALGNHDNRGFKDYKNGVGRYYAEPAEFFDSQFKGSYAYNGPGEWKTENYTFDYGNVHFSVIGINGPEEVNQWLIDDLSACDKTWKLGVYHFPICYSGVDCQNYDAIPVMREGLEKLDLLFSGHEHNFSRSFPLRNEEIFDKPSQGTVHYMLGNSNCNPPGSRTMSKIWHTAFWPEEENVAVAAMVEVDGGRITLTSFTDDGRIVDKCIIDKEKDEILPYALAPVFNRTRMMFKGMDLGLCQASTPCIEKDGVMYIPLAILISYIGGLAERGEGTVYAEIYGHSARITEGSDVMVTDRGETKLPGSVFRGYRDQLYAPADCVSAFEMRWFMSRRNNFISIETESEDKPVVPQP